MNKPTNDYEALVLALKLSITADTDEQFNRALEMAEGFSARLTDIEVARAKKEVNKQVIHS
tara:strand:- start:152 stop:334 length:183 start_codon:yes stop_codon:yes gene_type:complete